MSLSAPLFIPFLLLISVLYYQLPHRFRWMLLLAASYFFYLTWQPLYVSLLLFSTAIAYTCGRLAGKGYKPAVNLGIGLLLAPLAFYKYYPVLNDGLRVMLRPVGLDGWLPEPSYLLPVGISFYTFSAISYLIDIRRGYAKPEVHAGYFATYLSFFPTLLAGPIERGKRILPQLHKPKNFDYGGAVAGLQLIAWGLFKKLCIANPISLLINPVYANPGAFNGTVLYTALVMAPFQLFCDFSGYSDIARGAGRMLGIQLTQNFGDRVYAAPSRIEFWKGWHISLSSWFRDYVYFPLSKSLRSRNGLYLTIMIVYFLTGIWHGATWGYLIWGMSNGIWLVGEHMTRERRQRFFGKFWPDLTAMSHRIPSILIIFHTGALMSIFIRTATLNQALDFYRGIFAVWTWKAELIASGTQPFRILLCILLMDLVNQQLEKRDLYDLLQNYPRSWRWGVYMAVGLVLLILGTMPQAQFFYFQF